LRVKLRNNLCWLGALPKGFAVVLGFMILIMRKPVRPVRVRLNDAGLNQAIAQSDSNLFIN